MLQILYVTYISNEQLTRCCRREEKLLGLGWCKAIKDSAVSCSCCNLAESTTTNIREFFIHKKKENDKQTKKRQRDDINAAWACRFTCFLSLLLVLHGPTINKIKNLEMESKSNFSFLSFPYTLSPPSSATHFLLICNFIPIICIHLLRYRTTTASCSHLAVFFFSFDL